MVANFLQRSGDANTANHPVGFLEDTFDKLTDKTIGLLLADSGFYDTKVFEYLENKFRQFILNSNVKHRLKTLR